MQKIEHREEREQWKIDYLTWYEPENVQIFSRKELVDACKQNIAKHLVARDPKKYKSFLKGMRNTKWLLWSYGHKDYRKRIDLLELIYYTMRLYDDIIDWDTPIKLDMKTREKIKNKEIKWIFDILLEAIYDLAEEIGIEKENITERWLEEIWDWMHHLTKKWIDAIVLSMNYDLVRMMDTKKTRSEQSLDNNFDLMDSVGTMDWSSAVYWTHAKDVREKIWPLWIASRVAYSLNDLRKDLWDELINIPEEALEKYVITEKDIKNYVDTWIMSEGIQQRVEWEIKKIHMLLKEYTQNFSWKKILQWDGVRFNYQVSRLRLLWINASLKGLVFRKWYVKEIKDIVKNTQKFLGYSLAEVSVANA